MNIYKKIFIWFLYFLIVGPLFIYGQSDINNLTKGNSTEKLVVTGLIPGLVDGEVIYLSKNFVNNEENWLDSTRVKNGKFVFSHKLTEGPRLFVFSFPKHHKILVTALGNENVTITSSKRIAEIPNETILQWVKIDGSEISNDFLVLDFAIYNMWLIPVSLINNRISSLKDTIYSKDKLEHILGLIEAKNLIARHVQNMLTDTFYITRKLTPEFFTEFNEPEFKHDSLWVQAFKRLDDETKESYYGKIMKDYLSLCIGQPAPDFSFKTKDLNEISLKEVVKKNKLTILNFWSSTSDDRIGKHKELLQAYKKYQKKGLEIIGLSLDINTDNCFKILQSKKVPGIQICDFKVGVEAAQQYKINDLKGTLNIIIDQNGSIFAWDVEGPELFGYLYREFEE